jgi:membrane protein DedA with SNARE-associated domain
MTAPIWLQHAIETYGYLAIFLAVMIETTGIPFPGETALVLGAVYAGTGAQISIVGVIAAAAIGAIIGDNIGFTVGVIGGYPLLVRIARLLHIDPSKLRYAEEYFQRHGDKTVLIGRFFALLRVWVAFLAGASHMPRRSFFFWNATGGILWATTYGLLGYTLGRNLPLLERVLKVLGIGGFILGALLIIGIIGFWFFRRRRERKLLAKVERSADEPDKWDEPDGPAAGGTTAGGRNGASRQSGGQPVGSTTERRRRAREGQGQPATTGKSQRKP